MEPEEVVHAALKRLVGQVFSLPHPESDATSTHDEADQPDHQEDEEQNLGDSNCRSRDTAESKDGGNYG